MRKLTTLVMLVGMVLVFAVPVMAQDATAEPQATGEAATAEAGADATAEAQATADAVVQTFHVRLAHLSIDTPPIEVFVNGELSEIQELAYPALTGWVELPVGTYDVALAPIGEGVENAALTTQLTYAPNSWVTVAAIGSFEQGTLQTALINENYNRVPVNSARLTVLHALPEGPAVDVSIGDSIPVVDLAFSGAVTFEVPAGTADINVTETGTTEPSILGETGFELAAGSYYFAAVHGTLDAPALFVSEVTAQQVQDFVPDAVGTVVDELIADGRFTTLVQAVEAAGLTETLSGEGPFTIFAPVDAAFAALPEADLNALLEDPDALADLLSYHVVNGSLLSDDVLAASSLTSLQGGDLTVTLNEQGAFLNDNVQLIIVDIPASNGVIHAINAVLVPDGATSEAGSAGATPEATAEATAGS